MSATGIIWMVPAETLAAQSCQELVTEKGQTPF